MITIIKTAITCSVRLKKMKLIDLSYVIVSL